MKQIILNIGDLQYNVLEQYAIENNMSLEQYATNILVGWLNSHIQGFYIDKIKESTFETLENIFGKVKIKKG